MPVPSSTTEQYDEVVRRLGEAGVLPSLADLVVTGRVE
jgi:hypothetical protein